MNVQKMPRARGCSVVHRVAEEVIVVDDQSEAHCLPEITAFVFEHCDGLTPRSEVEKRLAERYPHPPSALLENALLELRDAGLIEETLTEGLTRRSVMGLAAGLAVASVSIPQPAAAMSGCPTCTDITGCPHCPGTLDPDCSGGNCYCLQVKSFTAASGSTTCSTDDVGSLNCVSSGSLGSPYINLDCTVARANANPGGYAFASCDGGAFLISGPPTRSYYLCCGNCT